MDHYEGIDVSLECSSVCVVEASGKIVREGKVASEPEALIAWFGSLGLGLTRIGLEAGPRPVRAARLARAPHAAALERTEVDGCAHPRRSGDRPHAAGRSGSDRARSSSPLPSNSGWERQVVDSEVLGNATFPDALQARSAGSRMLFWCSPASHDPGQAQQQTIMVASWYGWSPA